MGKEILPKEFAKHNLIITNDHLLGRYKLFLKIEWATVASLACRSSGDRWIQQPIILKTNCIGSVLDNFVINIYYLTDHLNGNPLITYVERMSNVKRKLYMFLIASLCAQSQNLSFLWFKEYLSFAFTTRDGVPVHYKSLMEAKIKCFKLINIKSN